MTDVFKLQATKVGLGDSIKNVAKTAKNKVKNALNKFDWRQLGRDLLFLEAIRNLNWSRGYDWFVELDDVPSPFKRGGVIGLPVVSINYDLINAETFSVTSSVETFEVPRGRGVCQINMTMLDDEKGTIAKFFERWYNMIYNNYAGVLPLDECVKKLSIYQVKSTRSKINRQYSTPGNSTGNGFSFSLLNLINISFNDKVSQSRDFWVFPTGTLQGNEKIDSGPREVTVNLSIAFQENADYGDPRVYSSGALSIGDHSFDIGSESFLGKLTNYI